MRHEFIKEYYGDKEWDVIDKDAYQFFIDNFINKNKGEKPIVFVGLNNMPWWHRDLYYDMHSKHNFYIKLDNESIVKQKCIRFLTEQLKDIVTDEIAMNDLIHNNKKFIKLISKSIDRECNASEIIADNDKWEKDYKNQGYKIISREDIYNEIVRKIENIS